MKKIVFVVVFSLSALALHAQLLYSISGGQATKKSYIVGTYHFAPSSFCDSIPGLWRAIDEVEQVCGELVMADVMKADNLAKMQNAMMLPEGTTLQSMLSDGEMARLNALCKEVMGMDFTNPLVAGQLGRLTPGALNKQLIVMLYLRLAPNFNPNDGIDTYLQTKALEKGRAVDGLETVDEQVKALFLSQSLDRQKQLLMCFVDNKEIVFDQTQRLSAAYFKQDLGLIGQIVDEKNNDACDSTDEENEVLIYGRNANWATKMPGMMADKSTLFVVGAAHLLGEKGVLQLLRNAGYVVEPVCQ